MKIVQLTPGTGGFHCGTCLRDNALVRELRAQGHDAILATMYLAPTLDEPPASDDAPLFYGGINVYLQQQFGMFRKTPQWLDRLLDHPGLLAGAASRAGMTSARQLGEMTISMLRGEEGRQQKELDRLTDWLAAERPDWVILSNALLLGLARQIRARTGARVACTLQGEDGFLDSFPEPYRTEAWNLLGERGRDVDVFIAVSHYYGDLMTRRAQLDAARVRPVFNGISLEDFPAAEHEPAEPTIGFLARMTRVKGLDTLIAAFVELRRQHPNLPAKLRVAGSCTAEDEKLVRELQGRLREVWLDGEVSFHPNLSREQKIEFLRGLTVLSVPATYGEAFGLYLAEAWAAGIPVVQPRSGAFPELLEASGAGLLCDPDDPTALAGALARLLTDDRLRLELRARARPAAERHFSVAAMADGVLQAFEKA